jgi:hypothetical protein
MNTNQVPTSVAQFFTYMKVHAHLVLRTLVVLSPLTPSKSFKNLKPIYHEDFMLSETFT